MATTTSSTGNFAASRYSEMIEKQLLEVTPNEYVFRSVTDSSPLKGVSGHSNQLKVNRNRRIAIPVSSATEGTAPTPTTLEIDQATGTAAQYVISVQFTDVAEIYAFHDLLSQATGAVKDAMVRLDEKVCSDAFVAASNVLYPNSVAARSSLTSADVLNTDIIAKAVAALRRGDNLYGPAQPFEDGQFMGLIHDWATHDLRKDATFVAAETRAMNAKLYEKGIIADWAGVRWKRTNWMPEYTNLATGMASLTIADNTAVSTSTGGLNGFKITTVNTGGTFADSTAYDFKVVRRHKLRGFEEGISSVLDYTTTAGGGSNDSSLTVVAPSSTDYWYDIYQGADAGTLYRVLQNVEGASSNTLTTPATSGTAAPVHSPVSFTTLPTFIVGKKAVKSSDLRGMESFITPRVSTHEDPAQQKRTVAAKTFIGAFIQQNAWIRKIEAATAFAS